MCLQYKQLKGNAIHYSGTIMNHQELNKITREQEKEITNILINSSLYLDMSPAEKQKLLRHLVSSYFDPLPVKNERAHPRAMQTGPAM